MKNKNSIETAAAAETETENFFNKIYKIERQTGKRVFAEIVKRRTPAIEEEFFK
ncbi:MAG: hypothetical protein JRJ44_06775, partial [Deltaproteobacteria bacterium]|nr:hypothetical protein [Deltaproteobacteria bacterium]